jgi:pilus assembly protein CpaB
MQRPGIIFLLSIVLGALFAALVYRYLREQQSAVEMARLSAKGATVDVVVADKPISVGARIEPEQLRVAKWPVELEPQGAIRTVDQAAGSIARVSIERNQPLQQSTLVPKGAGLLPLLITDGMRGMSVRVDSVSGVSGFITPNSRVDVLVSGQPSEQASSQGDQKGKVILQNVRVLATGKEIEQKDEKPVEVPTVTLLVSPEDAEKLTVATKQEAVRLALRNYRDEDIVPTAGIALKTLFQPDPGAKGAPQSSAPADKAPRTRSGGGVQVLLGDKVTRQPLY